MQLILVFVINSHSKLSVSCKLSFPVVSQTVSVCIHLTYKPQDNTDMKSAI